MSDVRMSSDFIIVPRQQAPPADTSPAVLVQHWFDSVHGIAPETVARLRVLVEYKLESGACRHMLPNMPAGDLPGIELQICVEQVITEQWDSLSPEERLLTRFPTVQAVGAYCDLPKRGKGRIVRRELTRRFGVDTVFELPDGSLFAWEFID